MLKNRGDHDIRESRVGCLRRTKTQGGQSVGCPNSPEVAARDSWTTIYDWSIKQKKQVYCFILRMALRRRSISDVGMAVVDGLAAVKIA